MNSSQARAAIMLAHLSLMSGTSGDTRWLFTTLTNPEHKRHKSEHALNPDMLVEVVMSLYLLRRNDARQARKNSDN